MKKTFCIFSVIILLLSLLSITAFAARIPYNWGSRDFYYTDDVGEQAYSLPHIGFTYIYADCSLSGAYFLTTIQRKDKTGLFSYTWTDLGTFTAQGTMRSDAEYGQAVQNVNSGNKTFRCHLLAQNNTTPGDDQHGGYIYKVTIRTFNTSTYDE